MTVDAAIRCANVLLLACAIAGAAGCSFELKDSPTAGGAPTTGARPQAAPTQACADHRLRRPQVRRPQARRPPARRQVLLRRQTLRPLARTSAERSASAKAGGKGVIADRVDVAPGGHA